MISLVTTNGEWREYLTFRSGLLTLHDDSSAIYLEGLRCMQ